MHYVLSFFVQLLVILSVCLAQEENASPKLETSGSKMSVFGEISVPLTISGITFEIQFEPELQSADVMAKRFCTEQASTLRLTEEDFPNCVATVGNHLLNRVSNWYAEKTFQMPLTVNGKTLDVSFIPEFTNLEELSGNICTKGVESTVYDQCVEKVTPYLRDQVTSFFAEKTLVVPLNVGEKVVDVSFLPERHSTQKVAAQVCRENAATLQITDDNLMVNCITQANSLLEKSVADWIASKTLDFTMTINEKPFSFTMVPERQTATEVARRFCQQHSQDYGFTVENIVAECVAPVSARVKEYIALWIASKEVTVRVTFPNGQTSDVSYMSDRLTSQSAATRFCVRNGASLGFTNETVVKGCIEPIADELRKTAITKFQQQQQQSASAA